MKDWWYIVIGLLVVTGLFGGANIITANNSHASSGSDYATDLAQAVGNPDAAPLFDAWIQAEGPAPECHNPMNTTLDYGINQTINSVKVRCYADYETGLIANIKTLNESPYTDVVQCLRINDAECFFTALGSSPWGTDASTVRSVYLSQANTVSIASPQTEEPPSRALIQSSPMDASGNDSCSYNVRLVMENFRHISIAPGQSWSFGQTIGNPLDYPYQVCAGVPGGNWCNFAAMFARVGKDMGLDVNFQDHGVGDLGQGADVSVAIWNSDGVWSQDLILTNTSNRAVSLELLGDDSIIVTGSYE